MKRGFILFAAGVLVLGLIAGCGGGGESGAADAGAEEAETTEVETVEADTTEAETAEAEPAAESEKAGTDGSGETDSQAAKPTGRGKPETFPEDAVKVMSEYISDGEPKLSEDVVEKVSTVYVRANELQGAGEDELDALLEDVGFSGREDFIQANTSTLVAMDAIQALGSVQAVIDSSEETQQAADSIELSEALESFAEQTLTIAQLTEEDLHFVYEHWEMFEDVKSLAQSSQSN
jgi:hypothetical protein